MVLPAFAKLNWLDCPTCLGVLSDPRLHPASRLASHHSEGSVESKASVFSLYLSRLAGWGNCQSAHRVVYF